MPAAGSDVAGRGAPSRTCWLDRRENFPCWRPSAGSACRGPAVFRFPDCFGFQVVFAGDSGPRGGDGRPLLGWDRGRPGVLRRLGDLRGLPARPTFDRRAGATRKAKAAWISVAGSCHGVAAWLVFVIPACGHRGLHSYAGGRARRWLQPVAPSSGANAGCLSP